MLWSNVKAYMQEGEVLMLYVRSSLGTKKGLVLANGTGIIDSDYYENPQNDGNIGMPLKNISDREVTIEPGEKVCQGIFVPYLVADGDFSTEKRIGGFGSTTHIKGDFYGK